MVVALTVTPMICAHFVRKAPSKHGDWLDRAVEGTLRTDAGRLLVEPCRVMRERAFTMLVWSPRSALTVILYIQVPKGYFPQDDTGLIFGGTRASPEISFERMKELQQRATEIVLADPAVAAVGSSVGGSGLSGSVNHGRLFINLKPLEERSGVSSQDVINRLRPKLTDVGGMRVFMVPSQDIRAGGRQSSSQYQFTVWSPDLDALRTHTPRIADRIRKVPEVVDVNSDREQGGLQAEVVVDRQAAARLGVRIADVGTRAQ